LGAGDSGSKVIVSPDAHTATTVGVTVGVLVAVGDPVAVGVRVAVGGRVDVAGGCQELVGVRVDVGDAVGVSNGEVNSVVGLLVGLGVALGVGVRVGVGVDVGVRTAVGVIVVLGIAGKSARPPTAAVPARLFSGSGVVTPAARRASANPTTMAQIDTSTKMPRPPPMINSLRSGGGVVCFWAALYREHRPYPAVRHVLP